MLASTASQLNETSYNIVTGHPPINEVMHRKMTHTSQSFIPSTSITHRVGRNAAGTANSSRNNLLMATGELDIQVKGKASIRTLLRLAN